MTKLIPFFDATTHDRPDAQNTKYTQPKLSSNYCDRTEAEPSSGKRKNVAHNI